jgi:hypothetical protein
MNEVNEKKRTKKSTTEMDQRSVTKKHQQQVDNRSKTPEPIRNIDREMMKRGVIFVQHLPSRRLQMKNSAW